MSGGSSQEAGPMNRERPTIFLHTSNEQTLRVKHGTTDTDFQGEIFQCRSNETYAGQTQNAEESN